jgi:hypothetical protein
MIIVPVENGIVFRLEAIDWQNRLRRRLFLQKLLELIPSDKRNYIRDENKFWVSKEYAETVQELREEYFPEYEDI